MQIKSDIGFSVLLLLSVQLQNSFMFRFISTLLLLVVAGGVFFFFIQIYYNHSENLHVHTLI